MVEDSEPYRALIVSLLNENLDLRVVGEVSDGLEAVTQAQELRPDVIVMDIGLRRLNGLEAARRIRALLPASKVVFLTLETDADVIQEAVNSGASAYVAKTEAATELLATLSTICKGQAFPESLDCTMGSKQGATQSLPGNKSAIENFCGLEI